MNLGAAKQLNHANDCPSQATVKLIQKEKSRAKQNNNSMGGWLLWQLVRMIWNMPESHTVPPARMGSQREAGPLSSGFLPPLGTRSLWKHPTVEHSGALRNGSEIYLSPCIQSPDTSREPQPCLRKGLCAEAEDVNCSAAHNKTQEGLLCKPKSWALLPTSEIDMSLTDIPVPSQSPNHTNSSLLISQG